MLDQECAPAAAPVARGVRTGDGRATWQVAPDDLGRRAICAV